VHDGTLTCHLPPSAHRLSVDWAAKRNSKAPSLCVTRLPSRGQRNPQRPPSLRPSPDYMLLPG